MMNESLSDSFEDGEVEEREEQWEDWEEQNEEQSCMCLFSNDICESVEDALRIDASSNGFDLKEFREKFKLSFYDIISLINYIRVERQEGRDPRALLSALPLNGPWPWNNDSYLVPVVENDAMMFYDWGDAGEVGRDDGESVCLDLVQEYVQDMDLNDPAVLELIISANRGHNDGNKSVDTDLHCTEQMDHSYFSSYAYFDIHREMLQDSVRTDCYRRALEENTELIKGSTVLDVGCGTGILSMFASRGGAARVFGVDGSPPIAKVAEQICKHNGFDTTNGLGEISIISSKIEDLQCLPGKVGHVDVIVSEWMGYALLFESMLDSVLIARDVFLRPGGAILPDVANIYIALGSYASEGLEFWDDIYGLSMTPIAQTIRKTHLRTAQVRAVDAQTLLSNSLALHSLDLATMKRSEQDFSVPFEVQATCNEGLCSCIILWFDTEFSSRFCKTSPQLLTTSPDSKPTHWAQTILPLPEFIPVVSGDKTENEEAIVAFKGRLSMSRHKEMPRRLDISLEYTPVSKNGQMMTEKTQLYSIGVNDNS